MLATRRFDEFYRHNDQELRCLVNTICQKHRVTDVEDTVQDVYVHFLTAKILQKYDASRQTKISTFLYPIISNLVLSKKKESTEMILRNRYVPPENYSRTPFHSTYAETIDPVDIVTNSGRVATEYMNLIHRNHMTDDVNGLGGELRDFVRFLESKNVRGLSRNKTYTLAKRKNSRIALWTCGCRLSDIYFLLYEGHSNKEIADMFGVSQMWISVMKRELAHIMIRGGITGKIKRKKNRRRPKNGRNKVSKMQVCRRGR